MQKLGKHHRIYGGNCTSDRKDASLPEEQSTRGTSRTSQVALHNRKKEQLLFEYTQLAVELKKKKEGRRNKQNQNAPTKMTGGEATNVDRIKIQDERGLSTQINDN